ncbi:conjugal transfer protein TrbE [Hyphomonas sp.]|uniref:conjugal transfer protein TrbE n=1 Tax=Hyphomonas sp. TaxID=87 RepID=UPI0025BA627A|nr:conjugal transfer protein TrbE [Hyphomonas sp.]
MLNLLEYAAAPRLLADYLPWAALVAPGVILNKDGAFQTTFRYRGPDLESSTESELVAVMARVNNAIRRFGSGWALFFEAVREDAGDYPSSDFSDAVSWLIDEERAVAAEGEGYETSHRDGTPNGSRFESTYYLTLLWLPPPDSNARAEKALIERPERPEGAGWRERLLVFQQQAERTLDLLSTAMPEVAPLSDSETLTYLHACISSRRHRVAAPAIPVFLDAILADEPFTGGLEPMIGDAHLRVLTILGFPGSTVPGLLDDLNRQGFAYRWATRFIAMDKAEAEKVLGRKRRHWFSKRKSVASVLRETMFNEPSALLDSDADNKALDADAALQELGSDLVAYGYVTTTITVSDTDPHLADERARHAERIINGKGFTVIRESLNAVDAWLGSLPGHVYANIRQPILNTLNLAHMVPLSAVWAGDRQNRHLRAPALIEAHTDGTTPFRLNLHAGDVGHTLILGPTGAGKSVLLAMLALQWQRYGGVHLDLGGARRPRLQPLKDIDQPAEASFAADWLAGLISGEGVSLTPELKARLWQGLTSLTSAPRSERTLTGLVLLLQDEALKTALHPFTLAGPHGRLLDGDEEDLSLASVTCFEMEELMQQGAAATAVLTYLFHRLEARFDGRPTLLMLDEAWLFLDAPVFAARLRDWLKTLRKKNVAVVFATQSLSDISASAIAPAILESCLTRIFLANERAQEPALRETYERFGLNARQIEIIARATPKRDYYFQSPKGSRLFDLGLGPVALAFSAAGSPEDQAVIDRVMAETEGEGFAKTWLHEKGLIWAADLLSRWPDHSSADRSPSQPFRPQILAAE